MARQVVQHDGGWHLPQRRGDALAHLLLALGARRLWDEAAARREAGIGQQPLAPAPLRREDREERRAAGDEIAHERGQEHRQCVSPACLVREPELAQPLLQQEVAGLDYVIDVLDLAGPPQSQVLEAGCGDVVDAAVGVVAGPVQHRPVGGHDGHVGDPLDARRVLELRGLPRQQGLGHVARRRLRLPVAIGVADAERRDPRHLLPQGSDVVRRELALCEPHRVVSVEQHLRVLRVVRGGDRAPGAIGPAVELAAAQVDGDLAHRRASRSPGGVVVRRA